MKTILTVIIVLFQFYTLVNGQCDICGKSSIACVNATSFKFCLNGEIFSDHVYNCPYNFVCNQDNDERCIRRGPSCPRFCGSCNSETNTGCKDHETFMFCIKNKPVVIAKCPNGLLCDSTTPSSCVDPLKIPPTCPLPPAPPTTTTTSSSPITVTEPTEEVTDPVSTTTQEITSEPESTSTTEISTVTTQEETDPTSTTTERTHEPTPPQEESTSTTEISTISTQEDTEPTSTTTERTHEPTSTNEIPTEESDPTTTEGTTTEQTDPPITSTPTSPPSAADVFCQRVQYVGKFSKPNSCRRYYSCKKNKDKFVGTEHLCPLFLSFDCRFRICSIICNNSCGI